MPVFFAFGKIQKRYRGYTTPLQGQKDEEAAPKRAEKRLKTLIEGCVEIMFHYLTQAALIIMMSQVWA